MQEEFTGKSLPPGLEDSLPTNLAETFDTVRSGVRRSAENYIQLCTLAERLTKRQQGIASDEQRFAQALRYLAEESESAYATDNNDVPLLNEGLGATAKHLETSRGLREDEARAWDEGVLEDLKKQRDCLVSVRDLFDRRDRYAKNNISQLERRIEANESKLAGLRAKPEGTVRPGEQEKVEQAILSVRAADHPFPFLGVGEDGRADLNGYKGQAIDRQPARARHLHPGVHPRRAAVLPAVAVPGQPPAPGLEPGAGQVRRAGGRQLARAERAGGEHAARGVKRQDWLGLAGMCVINKVSMIGGEREAEIGTLYTTISR